MAQRHFTQMVEYSNCREPLLDVKGKQEEHVTDCAAVEIMRIKNVYQSYDSELRIQVKRNRENEGNRRIAIERQVRLRKIFDSVNREERRRLKILDIGCGMGDILAGMLEFGSEKQNLFGIDLLPDRIEKGRAAHPGINFFCGNAEEIPLPSEDFDVVLLFTVFSSILDEGMAARLAKYAGERLKRGGAAIWYDVRYDNPFNPHIRGWGKRRIQGHFPYYKMHLRPITLLPPLARRLGPFTRALYPVLSAIRPLRTHYFGLLVKPI